MKTTKDENLTHFERAMKRRKMDLEHSIKELETLADANKDRVHFLSQEAYKLGIKYCIREIEDTEMLYEKAHRELPYADPEDAEREHKNQMNGLRCLKASFIRRYNGQP